MSFLLAITFLGWANMLASYRSLSKGDMPVAFAHFMAMMPLVFAFGFMIYLSPANANGVAGNARNWVPFEPFA